MAHILAKSTRLDSQLSALISTSDTQNPQNVHQQCQIVEMLSLIGSLFRLCKLENTAQCSTPPPPPPPALFPGLHAQLLPYCKRAWRPGNEATPPPPPPPPPHMLNAVHML